MVTKEGVGEAKNPSKQRQTQMQERQEDHHQERSTAYTYDDQISDAKRNRVGSDDGFAVPGEMARSVKKRRPMYTLRVIQQPERARLCSFKEENETIDRRPVDPPPVVELLSSEGSHTSEPESSLARYFIRASIVHPQPLSAQDPDDFPPVKTPTGADASAGEVVQTPENLRGQDGKPGKMVIFAKLSVRMPGVFRLKFTLFETTDSGLTEITHTVSEPFEVFSPKLFKGMRESTALTRHLAAQGLKVKLRTDTSVGRGGEARRRPSAQSGPSSPQPGNRVDPDTNRMPLHQHPPHSQHPPRPAHPSHSSSQPSTSIPLPTSMPLPPPSVPPSSISAPPRSLVWQESETYIHRRSPGPLHSPGMVSYPPQYQGPQPLGPSGQMPLPGPSHLGPNYLPHGSGSSGHVLPRSRFMDDGIPQMHHHPPLRRDVPAVNWTPSPSSDLAAFSLSQTTSQPHPSASTSRSSYSPRHFSPFSNQPSSSRSMTSSERSAEAFPIINDLRIRGHDDYRSDLRHRGQDDGFSLWPIFPTPPSVNNLLSTSAAPTPSAPAPAPPQDIREGSSDMTLPPIRVASLRRLGPGHGPGPPPSPGQHDHDMDQSLEMDGDTRGPSQ